MSPDLLRLIVTAFAAILLARQAQRAAARTRRRQAFVLGAAGFGLLTVANGLTLAGMGDPALLTLIVGFGLGLLLGSLVSLFLAYNEGELRDQFRRAGSMVAEERERLAERRADDERSANDEHEK